VQRITWRSYVTAWTAYGNKWVQLIQAKHDAVPSSAEGAARTSGSWILVKSTTQQWRPEFDPGPVHVWVVVDKAAVGQVCLRNFSSPLSVTFSHAPPRISFIYQKRYTILVINSILKCNIYLSKKGRNFGLWIMK
jgi:hypothetical protein